eukprot:scaffold3907_cov76-Skeletonema_dohrnii-CCMP3373.AAC.2
MTLSFVDAPKYHNILQTADGVDARTKRRWNGNDKRAQPAFKYVVSASVRRISNKQKLPRSSDRTSDVQDSLCRSLRCAVHHYNTIALHYACCGAKYETITLLLEEYDAVSVLKRNAQKKLPIHLLWESNSVEDSESVEYSESVFRLLKAYPEMMMNCIFWEVEALPLAGWKGDDGSEEETTRYSLLNCLINEFEQAKSDSCGRLRMYSIIVSGVVGSRGDDGLDEESTRCSCSN